MGFLKRRAQFVALRAVADRIFRVAPFLDVRVMDFDGVRMIRLQHHENGFMVAALDEHDRWVTAVVMVDFNGDPYPRGPTDERNLGLQRSDAPAEVAKEVLNSCIMQWIELVETPEANRGYREHALHCINSVRHRLGLELYQPTHTLDEDDDEDEQDDGASTVAMDADEDFDSSDSPDATATDASEGIFGADASWRVGRGSDFGAITVGDAGFTIELTRSSCEFGWMEVVSAAEVGHATLRLFPARGRPLVLNFEDSDSRAAFLSYARAHGAET